LLAALEEGLQAFEGDVLPAGDELGLQLVLLGDLGLALQAGEDFEDDPGFELGGEGSASSLGHRRTLLRGPVLTIVLVQAQGRTSTNTTGMVVNSGALNPELLKGKKGERLWAKMRLKDRIDAIIAHEYEELRAGGGHVDALKAAARTELPISAEARRLNRARAR
jgi:hypothetical protein